MARALRDVYGDTLVEMGADNADIVVLDADVSNSTKSCLFGSKYPERFFNVGIAEANMTAMAAGMASEGKIPFVNTFAVFLASMGFAATRCFASYSNLPIKLAGAYGGLSDSYDGPTHHALEDIAVFRTLPNLEVFVPSGETQLKWLMQYAVATPKPMYLRLSRDAFPDIYPADETFESGKGKIVRQGDDITIIACGLMVGKALQAAEKLAESGISACVVDMFSIKPIDRELIVRCAKATKAIISAEEHNVIGGLGSAVAEVLAAEGVQTRMEFIGVNDCHAECGSYDELQQKYGLTADAIAEKAQMLLQPR